MNAELEKWQESSEMITLRRHDYDELVRRLHEAEKKILSQDSQQTHYFAELLENLSLLKPSKVTMEF